MEIPDKCVHMTDVRWVEQILREGLCPGKNRFLSDEVKEQAVYVTSDLSRLRRLEPKLSSRRIAVLEVNMVGIKELFIPDNSYSVDDVFCWYSNEKVTPDRISVIGYL